MPEPGGASITFARYEYDAEGNLTAAADADGAVYRYRYTDDRRLRELEYPSGLVFTFRYDGEGRCIETWGEYPGRIDPALAADVPALLKDGITPAKGIHHCRFEYLGNGYCEASDSVRFQRFFAGPEGQIGKAVSARGGVTTREFDDRNRVISLTDPNDATWRWEYDGNNLVTRETDPEGRVLSIVRDDAGRELRIIDANGGNTSIERDADGEPTLVTDPRAAVLHITRDERGLVIQQDDARGARTTYENDAHGNCVAMTFPTGARFQWQYDYWGRLLRETDPLGAEASYGYSDAGRLLRITDRVGRNKYLAYDAMGNVVQETLPDGSSHVMEYGGLNWLFSTRLPDGAEQRASYNREGWILSFSNENGEQQRMEYDFDGKIIERETFNGAVARFGRDPFGHLAWFDEGSGKYEIVRDKTGAVLEVIAPEDATRGYRYNARRELIGARSGNVELRWERDAAGALIQEEQIIEGRSYTVKTMRNEAGDRVGMKTSLDHEVTLVRDATGRVIELRADGMPVEGYGRNLLGTIVERRLAHGGAVVDSYDPANRLRERSVVPAGQRASAEPRWVGRSAPGAKEWSYDYTAIDEISSVTHGSVTEYEFDVRRHLKSVTRAGHVEERFTVDAVSNYREAGPDAPPREYARGGRLTRRADTTYSYDDKGFLREKQTPAGTWRYTWSPWSLLSAVDRPDGARVEFDYDAFARRVVKRVLREGRVLAHQHFIWDRLTLVHEIDVVAPEPTTTRTYLYEDHDRTEPVAHRDAAGAGWVHYIGDVNDTPEELVDGSGRTLGRLDRSAFGRTHTAPGSTATTWFRFPGQYEDEETGLHYNRYRYYDPEAGRYISPDPIGILGGFALYAYGPNPITWFDPMGWKHRMTVQSENSGFMSFLGTKGQGHADRLDEEGAALVTSGMHNTADTDLNSQARCHTEQKLAHDMLKYHGQNPEALRGTTITASGQYPPCPNCHRALAKAAKETGAKVEYEWPSPDGKTKQKITYDGTAGTKENKQVKITSDGDRADKLLGSYGMTEDKDKRNGYRFKQWGGEGGAATTYKELTGELPELDD